MKVLKILLLLTVLVCFFIIVINLVVVYSTEGNILTNDDSRLQDADYILVLGAAVWQNKRPSYILEDRLLTGIEVYRAGYAPYILLSGDHGKENYDEVSVMKNFTVGNGVHENHVVLDLKGFSTYASCYNARQYFKVKKLIIVTQKYHLHRALYIAKALGIDAYGVASDRRPLNGDAARNFREVFARVKDFFVCLIKPVPRGEAKSSKVLHSFLSTRSFNFPRAALLLAEVFASQDNILS